MRERQLPSQEEVELQPEAQRLGKGWGRKYFLGSLSREGALDVVEEWSSISRSLAVML